MPITALDILPARAEPVSLSGLETGFKTHGTSTGKNDGPSFREMLEKAEQKDTTDGKIKESDSASQKKDADSPEKASSSAEKSSSAEEKTVESREKEIASNESQNNQNEETSADDAPEAFRKVADALSSEISDEVPVLPENAQIAEIAAEETAEVLEQPSEKVSLKNVAQLSSDKELPQELSDENNALASDEPAVLNGKTLEDTELVAKNVSEQGKAFTKDAERTEAALALKSAENSVESLSETEKGESKKAKKSRFSEYDSMMAMLSKQADKEAPAATTQKVASSADLASVSAKLNAVAPANEKIQVVDLRTQQENSGKAQKSNFSKQVSFDAKGNAEISMSLVSADKNGVSNGQGAGVDGLSKSDFASMLSKELETSAGDLVKTGSIVLQNNGKGSINLILHPEQLGNVKIKLELSDNQVSGKIVVASREAYDAFKENISAIKEAFSASGFETGGFELAWSGSGDGGNQNQQENRQVAQERTVNNRGMKYVDSMPDVIPAEYAGSGNVNLVA